MSNALAELKSSVAPVQTPAYKLAEQKKAAKAQEKEAKDALASAATPKSKSDKFAALEAVAKKLNAQFETTNSIQRLGNKKVTPVPNTPTGIMSVDNEVLGVGGVPDGRIIEIFGPESAGKTTLALELIAEEQRRNNLAAFVDAEHALDLSYAKKLGVNVAELMVSQPDSGEQALETVIALILSRAVSIVVIDSVAALTPQAELDGEMGDAHMGLQARMMSQAMRKIRGIASINGVKVVFINQIREKVGVMFGNPEVTTGGKALKFYSSVRLDVRRVSKTNGGEIMSGGVLIGHRLKIKAVKNKVATPFRETEVDVVYGKGIDRFADMVRYAIEVGAITKSGSWLNFGEEKLGQGAENAIASLRDNPELAEQVRSEVLKAVAAQREADEQ
jgi:recombination protein RecA